MSNVRTALNNVLAKVGEDSRRNGRVPVDRLLENMERERETLLQEKSDIEFKLSEVEDWRCQETSRILMRRMDKTRSIEATTRLESQARDKKAPLIKEKQAVEKRLHDIKSKFRRQGHREHQDVVREDVEVLLRIEKLLIQLVNASQSK